MKARFLFHLCMITAIMLFMPSVADAQIGGLGKLKDKAKEKVQKKVQDAKQDAKKELNDQKEKATGDVQTKAEFNTLNADQQWCLNQLTEMTEAPEMSGFFSRREGEKSRYGANLSSQESLMKIPFDTIQYHKRLADADVAYATKVLDIYKTLPKHHGYYVSEANSNKVNASHRCLERWLETYPTIEERVIQMVDISMAEFKVKKDGDKYIVLSNAILLPFCQGHPVQYDTKDNKFKFFVYKKNPTFIDDAEMKRQEESLDFMRSAAALLDNPDPSKRCEQFYKLDLAEQVTRQAMANNSRDNITYRERPKGSALNTSELRAEALKVLQKRFPGAGYEEVIITGENWVEVKNIFGITVERYVWVMAVCDGGIAKQLVTLSLGNDRTSTGWGPLHLYGVGGRSGYVK